MTVDEALQHLEHPWAEGLATRNLDAALVLAAEVRRLREVVARVEKLPERWREMHRISTTADPDFEAGRAAATELFADELDRALKPSSEDGS
jgi:hypothetical protein